MRLELEEREVAQKAKEEEEARKRAEEEAERLRAHEAALAEAQEAEEAEKETLRVCSSYYTLLLFCLDSLHSI